MTFNSIEFAIFLPIVFLLYWFVTNKNLKNQNVLLILASYTFYGWWDWRFLTLIIFSSFLDYSIGVAISKTNNAKRKMSLLIISILTNLGFLAFFKYFNFFAQSFADAFTLLGQDIEPTRLNIILPVGISFYTFQTLSYTIDVYKRKLEPTTDIISFFAFVSFFPQLVAGPIERATNLLPQFQKTRTFEYGKAVDGMRQILWGLFKKVIIADNCARFANQVFENHEILNGSTLILGAIFFTFQIYGDFSGYSDIAIGASRLFGFDLKQNFSFPYFSRDVAEFWRRWHISLNTWFRDYLYIPIGGSKGNRWFKIRNIFIIFVVSGLWHGANWTFIAWGVLNACYFIPLMLLKHNRNNLGVVAEGRKLPSIVECVQMGLTFSLTVVAWIFFRSDSIGSAIVYIRRMFSSSLFEKPHFKNIPLSDDILILVYLSLFIIVEWNGRRNQYAIERLGIEWNASLRRALYTLLTLIILLHAGDATEFIYFQF